MGREHEMIRTKSGIRQSGIPTRAMPNQPTRARGLMLKGVVMATYVVDDPNHFQADGRTPEGPIAVYCDVLSYTNISGMRWRYIPRCLVAQSSGGMHRGKVWKPRATTLDITGSPVDANKATNPANLDGDHVAIQFFNDELNEPVITHSIPHPNTDLGNENRTEGHRLNLKLADGDPDFWKHHGSFYGVDTEGNFVVDTTFANDGELEDDGKEAAPPTDGDGSQTYNLPNAAEKTVTFFDMADPDSPVPKFKLTMSGPDADFKWELEFVDAATKITHEAGKTLIDVKGANKFVVTDTLIELGAEGAADQAVLETKIQAELAKISAHLTAIQAWQAGVVAAHAPILAAPPVVPGDGGLGALTALNTALIAILPPVPPAFSPTNSTLVTIDS